MRLWLLEAVLHLEGKHRIASVKIENPYENKLKDIRFAFIELTKFKKKEYELKSLIDKWTFFIKNAPKLEVIPDSVDDEGLREVYLDADRHKWKKAELIAFDNASIAEQDEKGKISAAEKTLFTGQAQMAPY